MKNPFNGKGQTVLVTGAAGGLGKAFVEVYAKHNFNAILVDINEDALNNTISELKAKYPSVSYTAIPADLTDMNSLKGIHAKVEELGLTVDVLVNNAGAGKAGRVVDTDPDVMAKLIALNCTAPTVLTRLFGADMAARGKGKILNISSLAGIQPEPLFNVYGPSKSFDRNLSLSMFGEMFGTGVTTTILISGPIKTNWTKNAGKADSALAKDPLVIAREGFFAAQLGLPTVTTTVPYKLIAGASKLIPDPIIAVGVGKWQASLIEKK